MSLKIRVYVFCDRRDCMNAIRVFADLAGHVSQPLPKGWYTAKALDEHDVETHYCPEHTPA